MAFKLDAERLNKKIQQWQKIAIAACEQSGRNRIPEIRPAMDLEDWCAEEESGLKLNLIRAPAPALIRCRCPLNVYAC